MARLHSHFNQVKTPETWKDFSGAAGLLLFCSAFVAIVEIDVNRTWNQYLQKMGCASCSVDVLHSLPVTPKCLRIRSTWTVSR
jgi:hypothetical protein